MRQMRGELETLHGTGEIPNMMTFSGSPVSIRIQGNVVGSAVLPGAQYSIKVEWLTILGAITVVNDTDDFCAETAGTIYACPIQPGTIDYSQELDLPAETPAVRMACSLIAMMLMNFTGEIQDNSEIDQPWKRSGDLYDRHCQHLSQGRSSLTIRQRQLSQISERNRHTDASGACTKLA